MNGQKVMEFANQLAAVKVDNIEIRNSLITLSKGHKHSINNQKGQIIEYDYFG